MNKTKIKNLINNHKNKGFSIIEAMVAIFILTFSITVLMSVVANSISQSRYAKNELTATYLAQEVIDYIRNDRDSIYVEGLYGWDYFVNNYSNCIGINCKIDVYKDSIDSCYGNCSNLNYDENVSGGFYNYTYGQPSIFRRTVNIVTNGNEMKITVIINWKNKGNSNEKSLTMKSSLLNWY